ncbi:MAG: isochorismatase family protein [Acidimicrobiales bacterium]
MHLSELVVPERTAFVTVEVQEGVVGEASLIPELARAAEPILPKIAALASAARAAGIPVVHCTVDSRPDGRGGSRNARLFAIGGSPSGSLSPAVPGARVRPATVHAMVGEEDGDFIMGRLHGVSPMTSTSLDPVLRNLGVTTIVAAGVSVNVAILGLAFEAVNLGYQLVLPRDAVAGVDDAYVDAVFKRTLSLLATIATTEALLDAWADDAST